MNVLVTGGTGSIGAWVLHRLVEAGHRPVAYDARLETSYIRDIEDELTLVEGDVTDKNRLSEAMESYDIDRVIHLAKVVGRRGERDPTLALEVNVLGTGYVLQAANENDIRRVVFTSSKSVFEELTGVHAPPTFEPITEDYPTFDRAEENVPFYTTTNKMVEYYGIRYAMNHDMEFVITRFGSNYGPGKITNLQKWHDDDGILLSTASYLACAMTNRALRGESMHVADDAADNFVYTKDLASGVVKAATSDEIEFRRNHREFLLDGGMVVSLSDFAAELSERFPDVTISVGEDGIELAPRRSSACAFDISRAKRELNHDPAYDLSSAIDDYIETERRYRDY